MRFVAIEKAKICFYLFCSVTSLLKCKILKKCLIKLYIIHSKPKSPRNQRSHGCLLLLIRQSLIIDSDLKETKGKHKLLQKWGGNMCIMLIKLKTTWDLFSKAKIYHHIKDFYGETSPCSLLYNESCPHISQFTAQYAST